MENNEQKQSVEENKKKINKRFIITPLAILLLALCGYMYYESSHYQSTDDAYVECHMVKVAPKVSGEVVETYIDDNQEVKEGDLVLKIDDSDYKIRYEQADARYQKAILNQKVAQANFKASQSEINLAKVDLERYQKLYQTGAVSKQVLDNAQTKYDNIQAKYKNAEEQIITSDNSNVIDADIKALKAARDQAKLYLDYTNVIAPRNGKVTNKSVEKGAFVSVGQPLFTITPSKVWIVANYKESQVGKMKPGQEVKIKIDAYPNKTFKGKIDSIQMASGAKSSLFPPENAVGSFVKIVQRIPVKIVFDEEINPEEYNIVTGMSVVPKVRVK